MNATTEGYRQARQVYDRYWGDDLGVPVDPYRIANALGLQVIETTLPREVSGALVGLPGQDPVVLLEQSDSRARKRFTCAHELGHFIARSSAPNTDENYHYIDLRDPRSSDGSRSEEVFANAFAAELVMPEHLVKRAARGTPAPWLLADRFGVSADAMTVRLRALGIKTEEHLQYA